MRSRRTSQAPAITFLALALTALFAGWTGCASGSNTNHAVGSTGTGNRTGTGGTATGGSGGASTSTGGMSAGGSGTGADGGMGGDSALNCGPTQKMCATPDAGVACVDVSDPNYGCGPSSCTPCMNYPNASAQCLAGTCSLGACNAGFKNCDGNDMNGCEVNIGSDPNNCGACGAPCVVPHATASCTNGVCGVGTCDSGWTDCNGTVSDGCEANLPNDPMNCGMCANQCMGLQTCMSGSCGLICPKGQAQCMGDPPNSCATMLGTNKDCSFCGDACALPNSTSQCMQMGSANVCNLQMCNTGFSNCDMIAANGCEVNNQTDANNCGSCGNICPSGPNSTAICNAGACGITCTPGFYDCDKNPNNGCEVNGTTDPNNCGGCGTICPTANDAPTCVAGVCTVGVCNTGFADCDMKASDGCEINTTNDPKNCGVCGTLCAEANGTAICNQSNCALGPCNPGFLNCDGKYTSGCNVNGNTDPNNCGGCNNVCNLANASATCTGGSCTIGSCSAGFADCDKMAADGCEANTTTSTANCGSCGNACNPPNAMGSCANSMCGIASCNPGFANCDGAYANGCEVNTLTDVNNCGGCGVKCNLPNAVAACTNGMCTIAACNPGFQDCDKNATNGCEVNTGTDPNNCGGCGAVCNLPNATAGCAGGTCTVAGCKAGFQNCDNVASNGCEVDVQTDPNNCGGCFHQCFVPNGTAGCGGGNCTVASCNSGFANCDGNVANGCEVNTTNDNNNCGGCGNACLAVCGGAADHVTNTQCSGSQCAITSCLGGYQDFDGKCSDGCECLDSTTQANCASAQALFAGTLQPGNSISPFSSSMAPLTVTQAYFTLTFGGSVAGTAGMNAHPKINLASPNNEFLMDITQDCSGTSILGTDACGDNGTNSSKAVLGWEVHFTGANPGNNNPFPEPGAAGQVWIRVYRNPLVTPTCNQYTITASD